MKDKILNLMKSKTFTIPLYIYQKRSSFGLSLETFIMLMYLRSLGDKIPFNALKIAKDLEMEIDDVMASVEELSKKNLIEIKTEKHEKGYLEDYLLLDGFYNSLSSMFLNKEENTENIEIYSFIESAFGRPLSNKDYGTIKSWLASDISDQMIKKAVNEAVKNGKSQTAYIDRILYEWMKKGKVEDKLKEEIALFDYDWLNE